MCLHLNEELDRLRVAGGASTSQPGAIGPTYDSKLLQDYATKIKDTLAKIAQNTIWEVQQNVRLELGQVQSENTALEANIEELYLMF